MSCTHAVVPLIVVASVACATAGSRHARSCTLAPADSVYLAHGPVYLECAVDQRARVRSRGQRPYFEPSAPLPGGEACFSVEIQFVVDGTGLPELETARVVRTNDMAFSRAVLATLATWRYYPARKNGVPVRQIVREKRTMAVQVVVVRSGDVPRPGRPPRC
jgi:hypothetical protein